MEWEKREENLLSHSEFIHKQNYLSDNSILIDKESTISFLQSKFLLIQKENKKIVIWNIINTQID